MQPTTPASGGEPLIRAIGTFGLAAAIINITIGAGIFRLPGSIAGSLGAAAPLAYLVCAGAMALIVLSIADAGRRVSLTGGPYAYVGAAFGPYVGFLSGIMLWMLGTFATAAVSTVFASQAVLLIPGLEGRGMELLLLVAVFTFWTTVNLWQVTLGVRLNTIATVTKLLPLLLVAVGGLFFIEPANLEIPTMPPAGDIARTSLLLIFAFAGIEVALVPSGEVRNTARTVPRAIILAMIGITSLYVLLQVVAQGVLGSGLAQATVAPLADTAGAAFGGWGRSLLLAGAAISTFGYLGGVTLSMPRILFALARDGFLPRILASVHPVHRSPQAAVVTQSVVTVALAATGTFERLAIFANVAALLLYLGCALAALRLRQQGVGAMESAAPVPLGGVAPWLACIVILFLLSGMTRWEWLGFAGCVVVGTVIYVATSKSRALASRAASVSEPA